MNEACLFDILQLPEEALTQVLPKASLRTLARLLKAYPRSIGQLISDPLVRSMHPATFQLLLEEMQACPPLTFAEIREAELALLQVIQDSEIPDNLSRC